ncbi:PEP-CTERM sorting domain-containing protein [Desulfobacter curvatus]|uniref:PEP-CTERM sorting domain-containing protein n=1 Tax=Desulfobacter curvatus TaxID=2290 RepID=UPI00035CA802|nr:PEP-CTERM sorting domain-containing protein [Desulfobacter curvatus]
MKQKLILLFSSVTVMFLLSINANAASVKVLSDVPAYSWYHGCGPTAAASILGYYDLHGYDSLFDASGWNDVRLTSNVQDEISSPAHNLKYDPEPDEPYLDDPPDASIADFFHTSEDKSYISEPQTYGWSYLSDAADAFIGYAKYRGYDDWDAWNEPFGSEGFTWNIFTNEIDNDRPVMFLIDTDADNSTDHFVPVFGYNTETMEYACYTTRDGAESETVSWQSFQDMGNDWGIGYATFVLPGASDAVPIPSTIILLGVGLMGLAGMSRKNSV